jgi:hypothetical protein
VESFRATSRVSQKVIPKIYVSGALPKKKSVANIPTSLQLYNRALRF